MNRRDFLKSAGSLPVVLALESGAISLPEIPLEEDAFDPRDGPLRLVETAPHEFDVFGTQHVRKAQAYLFERDFYWGLAASNGKSGDERIRKALKMLCPISRMNDLSVIEDVVLQLDEWFIWRMDETA